MLTSILVPIDGSVFAEHAVPAATELARRTAAKLHIVRVHQPPILPSPDAPVIVDAHWLDEIRAEEEAYLESIARRVRERSGLEIATALIDGFPADAIAGYARDHAVGLIVMTTHGRGGISRFWLGSVADGVVRHSRTPVLLLHPRSDDVDWERGLQLRHVLVPQDGSDLARSVVQPAIALGALAGARYTLMRVTLPLPPMGRATAMSAHALGEEALAEARGRDEASLAATAEPLRRQGYSVDTVVVSHPTPPNAILEFAATNAVDLIALATRGRSGWTRVALGSVADKVMRGSTIPVLLYRPAAPVVEKRHENGRSFGRRLVGVDL
jgi:nucleotide-binding universal stress UspA family protein